MTDSPRAIAFALLRQVEDENRHIDELLEQAARHASLDRRDRAFVSELVYGVTRWRRSLDALITAGSSTPFAQLHASVITLLRLGLYQILLMDGVPERAAVSETVRLAKEVVKQKNLPGFVNGVLRGFLRTNKNASFADAVRRALPETNDTITRFGVEHSLPHWLAKRWLKNFGGETAHRIARETNRRAAVFVRRNRLKGSEEAFLRHLAEAGVEVEPFRFVEAGYRLIAGSISPRSPLFIEGWLQPQDGASMIATALLRPEPGETIVDLCCGKGIKSGAYAETMRNEGIIHALDIAEGRLRDLAENMRRLGVTIHKTALCDVSGEWPVVGPFTKIYVDAPCSATGVIRRHPESKWNRDEGLIGRMTKIQAAILQQALAMLAPGGTLVYSVCSIEPEEGEERIEAILQADPTLQRAPFPSCHVSFQTDKGDFFTAPGDEGMDGFFAAKLIRNRYENQQTCSTI